MMTIIIIVVAMIILVIIITFVALIIVISAIITEQGDQSCLGLSSSSQFLTYADESHLLLICC